MNFENFGKSIDTGLSTLVKKFNEKRPSKETIIQLGHKAKIAGLGVTAAALGKIAEKSMNAACTLSERAEVKPIETHKIEKTDVEGLSDLFPAQ